MKRIALSRLLMACTVVAGVTIAGFLHSEAASPTTVKPGKGDDLRAAYATAVEVAEGKRVAEASCASCHGMDGISNTKGAPHLAGQRPAYLHLELRAYQTGARGVNAMAGAVKKFLSDDALASSLSGLACFS